MAVPALRPDVAVIHAQQTDRRGNVAIWGIVGIQKEAVMLRHEACHRDGRGDRGRARASPLPGRSAVRGHRCDLGGALVERTPPTPTATTPATTPSTRRGTRSVATARRSGNGWSATSSAPEECAEYLETLRGSGADAE